MPKDTIDVQKITGVAKSVHDLFSLRYGLDFYQREYSWTVTQVTELIDDLAGRFQDEFDPTHDRDRVEYYRPYFLGPIMTTERDATHYLIDGQQRITTMMLLLIHLYLSLKEEFHDDHESLGNVIFSHRYGSGLIYSTLMKGVSALMPSWVVGSFPSRRRVVNPCAMCGGSLKISRTTSLVI